MIYSITMFNRIQNFLFVSISSNDTSRTNNEIEDNATGHVEQTEQFELRINFI